MPRTVAPPQDQTDLSTDDPDLQRSPAQAEISPLARDYKDTRDRRQDLTKQESDRHAELLEAMRRHGVDEIEVDGDRVYISRGKDKVRVRSKKDDDGQEDLDLNEEDEDAQ